MTMECNPIVFFAHSRPEHTHSALEALASNAMADQSDIIVFADGPRNEFEAGKVRTVREIVHAVRGFKSVRVVERECNYGLARNIIEGVTSVCASYGRAIVVEDDIVTCPQFLEFMNKALTRYAEEPRVWHISGWNYPIDPEGIDDAFFWRVMNCWGWATWSDRWKHFQKDPQRLIDSWSRKKISSFNLDGAHDFWGQVKANHSGVINTWAIFWYATIFEHDGLCLNPSRSLVRNIGHDNSGEHCGASEEFSSEPALANGELILPDIDESTMESEPAVQRIKAFYRQISKPLLKRLMRRAKQYFC
jgi:hypothetical protein